MISPDSALEIMKAKYRELFPRWKLEDYGSRWESLEEEQRMRIWLDQTFDERDQEVDNKFADEWEGPIEAPCGWLFIRKVTRLGGPCWYLIDKWTDELFAEEDVNRKLGLIYLGDSIPLEARIRLYIDALPLTQRFEALKRIHLLPYAPIRFYPPCIVFDTPVTAKSNPHRFIVEFDMNFFEEKDLSIPDVMLEDWIQLHNLDFVDCPEEVQKIREWFDQEKLYCEYQIDLLAKPSRRYARISLRFAFIPSPHEETARDIQNYYFPRFQFDND